MSVQISESSRSRGYSFGSPLVVDRFCRGTCPIACHDIYLYPFSKRISPRIRPKYSLWICDADHQMRMWPLCQSVAAQKSTHQLVAWNLWTRFAHLGHQQHCTHFKSNMRQNSSLPFFTRSSLACTSPSSPNMCILTLVARTITFFIPESVFSNNAIILVATGSDLQTKCDHLKKQQIYEFGVASLETGNWCGRQSAIRHFPSSTINVLKVKQVACRSKHLAFRSTISVFKSPLSFIGSSSLVGSVLASTFADALPPFPPYLVWRRPRPPRTERRVIHLEHSNHVSDLE